MKYHKCQKYWQIAYSLIGVLWLSSLSAFDMVVVCPTYKNERVCIKNIESVAQQTYTDWHMLITDDCSPDDTYKKLRAYIDTHNLSQKITLRRNSQRQGAMKNLYEMIHACPDHVKIVTLDGDDWLADSQVLSYIAQAYKDPQVWLTYGQYKTYPENALGICRPFPEQVLKDRSFRTYQWVSSHPRTFYAWLFKKIKAEDFIYKGAWMSVAWDLAMMLPMLEMASNGHIKFLSRILYIYNDANPLNDFRHSLNLQLEIGRFICEKPKYDAL